MVCIWASALALCAAPKGLGHLGRFPKWGKIEVVLAGPDLRGRADPNPFAILVDAVFTSPTGNRYEVPAFYDGDGKGSLDGHVWKVRFAADETGEWTFGSTSEHAQLDGYSARFTVTSASRDAPGFWRWGRLERVGTPENGIRYLKFREGPYWLKAGCDDPENFLGRFSNYDTIAERKAAVDYLAARGVNSLYMMTNNIDGDHRDVWPWLGATPSEAKTNASDSARFDVAKLEEWRELFEYMQAHGVVPYLVLDDDDCWTGYDRPRYYREMVARFGYLPALLFNISEEHAENYTLEQALAYAQLLKDLDPFDHPVGIHDVNGNIAAQADAYVDASQVDFTSIQTGGQDPLVHNPIALEWIARCQARSKRVLMVGFDEGRPEEDRRGWWSAYLGGGVWEVHVRQADDRPHSAWEPAWTQLGGARAFMESLPFWEMEPANHLVESGTAFCLAKPGEAYALYLPVGGSVEVELLPGTYDCAWWKASNGSEGSFEARRTVKGGKQQFTAPAEGDWALRVVKKAD